jgi:hypothetical protein
VNGYSGYEPSYYEAVVQGSRFEVNGLFTPFRAREDLFVVVGRGQTRLRDLVERQPGVVRVAERDGVLEYRLPRGAPPETDDSRMTRLPIASAMSTCLSDATPLAFDGDLDTRWMCGPQSGHETFVVDLGHPVDDVALVRYALGRYFKDFPRELIIDTSVDGETWEPGRAGDVVEATIEGAMAEPLRVPATLRFAPRRARYVRLRQVGHDDAVDWSLAELEIRAAPLGESAKGY